MLEHPACSLQKDDGHTAANRIKQLAICHADEHGISLQCAGKILGVATLRKEQKSGLSTRCVIARVSPRLAILMSCPLRSAALGFFLIVLTNDLARAGLIQSFQQTGQIGVEIAAAAGGNPPITQPAAGSFTLSNFLPGQVTKATLYANTVNSALGLDATFGGVPAIPAVAGPFASDNSGILTTFYGFQWDVTNALIPGPGTYNYAIGQNMQHNQISGVALIVIYNNPGGPLRQITIVDGIQSVAENGTPETESFNLTNVAAGATQLSLFTVQDDNAGTGEQIKYNGNLLGTNIDQNLGLNASFLQFSTTSSAGINTVDLVSSNSGGPLGVDNFGWMLTVADVIVPEPGGISLAGAGLLTWIFFRLRRR